METKMDVHIDVIDVFVRIPRAAARAGVNEHELLGRYLQLVVAMETQGTRRIHYTDVTLFLAPNQIDALVEVGVIGWNDGANSEDICLPNIDTEAAK